MKVNVKSAVNLGNKDYAAGVQEVPDSLYANVRFKELVKSGVIVLLPRDADAQRAQASKDSRARLAAQTAQDRAKKLVDARAGEKNNKSFSEEKPALGGVAEAQAKLPAQAVAPAAAKPAQKAAASKKSASKEKS